MVLEVKAKPKMPLILKQPLMKTTRILVDMDKGQMKVGIKYCEMF